MKDPRKLALKALIKILEKNTFADDALSSVFVDADISPQDKGLVTEIVYGATRNKLYLDYYIQKLSSVKLKKLSHTVKNVLRMGLYQLIFMRIPDYAAVNSSVKLIKQLEKNPKAASFVNGVLRGYLKKQDSIELPDKTTDLVKHWSVKYSHPEWLVTKWIDTFGKDETENLLIADNTSPTLTINVNLLRTTRDKVQAQLAEVGVSAVASEISPTCLRLPPTGNVKNLPGFDTGDWVIQDELSSFVVDVLSAKPGETILDLCAAPGSKTVQIAAAMQNTGHIIAVEINENRLSQIYENCNRLGVRIISPIHADGRSFLPDPSLQIDKILIDAPCSNTGVLARRADARWHRDLTDIHELAKTQYQLIEHASQLLSTKGTMVYSVCSIEPEEGIDIIEKFLSAHEEFRLVDIRPFLPQSLSNTFSQSYLPFLPSKHQTDGFFIACLTKEQKY